MPRSGDPSVKHGSGMANQDSIDANAFVDEVVEGDIAPLKAHLQDPSGAHAASAISTTGSKDQYFTTNAQGNFDEIAALIPIKPPTVGGIDLIPSDFGVPDWGILKLRDAGFTARGDVTPPDPASPNLDGVCYPEFWWPAYEAADLYGTNPPGEVFVPPSNDPASDSTFNVDPAGTGDPTYTGGGPGVTHEGAFVRGGREVIETPRIIPNTPNLPVVVSGKLFPADRGVLALLHWPPGGDVVAFLAQPLDERVLAAIKLGQGIDEDCDGDPGGIFTEGSSITSFPGRATGQYDLEEIHLGINSQTAAPLPAGPLPGAGQVRLGTDPLAGPVIPGGIKILGGTTAATGGGNDNNFFRYRLPYSADYSDATGLPWVPAVEKPRYFNKPLVALNYLTALTQAGDYENFEKDYWTYQVARYRHRFTLLTGPDQGSYFLLHFQREADFEAFARDGVMPDDATDGYDLWSEGLVDYYPESTDNLADTSVPATPLTSTAYHVLRSSVFEDPDTTPVTITATYTYVGTLDEVMFCSGIQYFLPNAAAGVGEGWKIDSLTLQLSFLWNNAFLLGHYAGSTEITPGLWHRPPVVLYLGLGTSLDAINNGAGVGYTGTAGYQKVDFDYSDLDVLNGPYTLTNGPLPGETADIILTNVETPIKFRGDDIPCHFWHGGNVRAFARRPLGNQTPATVMTETLFPEPGGDHILFHTTSHSPNFTSGGEYGNFTAGPNNYPRPVLETARKDVQEILLDEVYRWALHQLPAVDPTYDAILGVGNLVGPGLPFAFAPIDVAIRVGSSPAAVFGQASFVQNNYHLSSLAAAPLTDEAQVAGIPDRNPPATDGVQNPIPFAGRVIYPSVNYSTGYRPSLAAGDVTSVQYDYSAIAEPVRSYLRVLDAAYSEDTTPEPGVVGQSFVYLRVDGLHLADFAYAPLGPGNTDIAINLKIPGLTTWMDVGRVDGAGPSKQDPLVDGAGCQVVGPETFDGYDAQTGVAYCQVKVNVGPAAFIFANTTLGAPEDGMAPVMIRVDVPRSSTLDFTQGGPNASSTVPRAFVGITVLRLSTQQGPDPFPAPPFP